MEKVKEALGDEKVLEKEGSVIKMKPKQKESTVAKWGEKALLNGMPRWL